ncbi:hypothetical protein CANCADRAFT_17644, partial [Tortispora caseinolytica NRRL Y-17796]
DKSPKGSIDTKLIPAMELINQHPDMFTTSSCSGRVTVFGGLKHTGTWKYVCHDKSELLDGFSLYKEVFGDEELTNVPIEPTVWFKFEPVILHVQCNGAEWSRTLLIKALDAGMRESGIGPNQMAVAIRTGSLRMEAPIGGTVDDKIVPIVTPEYLDILVKASRKMFDLNDQKIDRL